MPVGRGLDESIMNKGNKFTVWIDGRRQTKPVTADTPELAGEAVYEKWGISRASRVEVKLKFAASTTLRDETGDHHPDAKSTRADALAFMLGCELAGWPAKLIEQRAGLKPLERQRLEQAIATAPVKAAAWRALEAHYVPMNLLLEIATKHIEQHPEWELPKRTKFQFRARKGL
jgi:hypothetical protein